MNSGTNQEEEQRSDISLIEGTRVTARDAEITVIGLTSHEVHLMKFTTDRLNFRRVIGFGNYGVVKLAQDKETGKALAVKETLKIRLQQRKNVANAKNEKTILASLRHPLVVDFYGTCQDEKKLYLVMEYVQGGELLSLLERRGKLTVTEARFYAAEVTSVFTYLHSQGIAYRDLKPENVLISKSGHIKITDLGCSKRLKLGERTFSLCGTPQFLAPEVIMRSGHDSAVDWWTLGIFLHELLSGVSPFTGESAYEIYSNIISHAYTPPKEADEVTQELLIGLLDKDPGSRLVGEKVRSHCFFAGVDWDHVDRLEPVYIPVVKAAMDDGNFEEFEEQPEAEGVIRNQEVFQDY